MGVKVTQKAGGATTAGAAKPAWMMTGKTASTQFQQEEELAKQREEERGKAWRFFMKEGGTAAITFLDGLLDDGESSFLSIPMFYEHTIRVGGEWKNFICTQQQEPCPICATGDRAAFVGVMTVVDHRITSSSDGSKQYRDQKRLFVCKRNTMKMLNTLAQNPERNGLRLCTFNVSRTGKKDPNVGNLFDFTKKWTKEAFEAKYDTLENSNPFDYNEHLVYRTAAELKKIGFSGAQSIGGSDDDDGGGIDANDAI